jgi:hypothetical protein
MAAHHHVTVLQALVRDGYRCRLCGFYDYKSVQTWPTVKAMAEEAQAGYTYTECCHIFLEGTLQSVDKGEHQARGSVLVQGPNTDYPTEGSRCYCVCSVRYVRT